MLWQSVAVQTESFPDAFVREEVVHGYDIVTFEGSQADAILIRKNQCNKKVILMFLCDFSCNLVKYSRKMISHGFFHCNSYVHSAHITNIGIKHVFYALTSAGPRGWC